MSAAEEPTIDSRKPMNSLRRLFIGPDRLLRPIWRAIIYFVAGAWVVAAPVNWTAQQIGRALQLSDGLTAANITLGECANFLIALIPTAALALYERRRIDSYGLPVNRALGGKTFEGLATGILLAGVVAVGMIALGGMQVRGFALTGTALIASALAWLGANICVGIAEEFWFRSYFQQTLWKSIGFWPSATVVALVFAAIHYFYKPGENIWDVITLVSFSLLMSYSFLRTGTLWFAVGVHIGFDYMQLFVIGTPNGARIPEGRLLDVSFHGPAWLTGGALGTEASFLMYPAIALLWIYVWRRARANPPLKM